MKFLAIEKENKKADWTNAHSLLKPEAKHVYSQYLSDVVREIYFNEHGEAVIILESENKKAAQEILNSFPLVQAGLIYFEVMQLLPYTGLKRIIED